MSAKKTTLKPECTNPHKGKIMKRIRFWPGEIERLTDAVSGNYKDKAFNILAEISNRGDL